jgi:hypothetical protein
LGIYESISLVSLKFTAPSVSLAGNLLLEKDWLVSSSLFATIPISSASRETGKATQEGGSVGPKRRVRHWSLSAALFGGFSFYKESEHESHSAGSSEESHANADHGSNSGPNPVRSSDSSNQSHGIALLDGGHDHSSFTGDSTAVGETNEKQRFRGRIAVGYALFNNLRIDSNIALSQITSIDNSRALQFDATILQGTYSLSP